VGDIACGAACGGEQCRGPGLADCVVADGEPAGKAQDGAGLLRHTVAFRLRKRLDELVDLADADLAQRVVLEGRQDELSHVALVEGVDAGQDNAARNYDTRFTEADYTRIPTSDLPFGLPAWFGDDRWGRQARPRHNNSVEPPADDPEHTFRAAPEQRP